MGPRRIDPRCRAACLALIAVLAAAPLRAQDVRVDVFAGRADRDIVRNTVGAAIRVGFHPLPFVGLGLSWSRHSAVSGFDGEICDAGGTSCTNESLRNDIEMRTIGYELYLPLHVAGFEVSAAAGVDATSVPRATLHGRDSGRTVTAYAPSTGTFKSFTDINGRHYRVGLGIHPFGLPLAARVAWQHRTMNLDACVADAFAPFCKRITSNELMLGLSIAGPL
jgi:hypothetical protein